MLKQLLVACAALAFATQAASQNPIQKAQKAEQQKVQE
jgi:hypothetical protein